LKVPLNKIFYGLELIKPGKGEMVLE